MEPSRMQVKVIKMFEVNVIFSKPNITSIGTMISTIVFAAMIVLAFSYEQPRFEYIMIGYGTDLVFEAIIIGLYYYVRQFMQFPFQKVVFVPFVLKLLACVTVTLDLLYGSWSSIFVCWAVLFPFFFKGSPRSCYYSVSAVSNCNGFMYAIAEFLLIIRLSVDRGASYYGVFSYLFYFLMVSMFFTGIVLLVSLVAIIMIIFKQRSGLPLKVHILQAFYGLDNLVQVLLTWYVSQYCKEIDNIRVIR